MPVPDVHEQWSFAFFMAFVMLAIAAVYLRGWIRFRSARSSPVPAWRRAAFLTGLLTLWTAGCSPLSVLDHRSLTAHMLKHLILMTVAAPLILAATPALRLLNELPNRSSWSILLLGRSLLSTLTGFIADPVFCWVAATCAVIGWHLPGVFGLGQRSHWIHSVEDASFFLAGLLFWWPIMKARRGAQSAPDLSAPLYLFLATLPCDILSAFLVFSNRVVYSGYAATTLMFGWSPLEDQECAGALMWVWVTFAYLIPAAVITVQALSAHQAPDLPGCTGLARGRCHSPGAEVL